MEIISLHCGDKFFEDANHVNLGQDTMVLSMVWSLTPWFTKIQDPKISTLGDVAILFQDRVYFIYIVLIGNAKH